MVALGALERIFGFTVPRKIYALVFVVFFFLGATYLAWKDQFDKNQLLTIQLTQATTERDGYSKQVDQLKTELASKERPIEIVTPTQTPEHLAQLHFENPVPFNGGDFQLLTAGKGSAFNVGLVNQGPYTAEKTKAMWTLSIFDIPPSVTDAGEVTKIAHKQFKDSLSQIPKAAKNSQVYDLDPGRGIMDTVYTHGVFTDDLIKKFKAENAVFLVLGYAEWHDSAGKHTKYSCLWINIFTGTDKLDGWHICD